jgi:hypothetical protein
MTQAMLDNYVNILFADNVLSLQALHQELDALRSIAKRAGFTLTIDTDLPF